MFIRNLRKLKKGFSIVFALTLFVVTTLITGVTAYLITLENKNIKTSKINTDFQYAINSAEKLADIHLSEYVKAKATQYLESFNGQSGNPVISNPQLFFQDLYNNNYTKGSFYNGNFQTSASLNDKIYQVSSSYNTSNQQFEKKEVIQGNDNSIISYKYLFCDDKDNNLICSDVEKNNSLFIRTVNIDNGKQTYSYNVKYTIYVFNTKNIPNSASPTYDQEVQSLKKNKFYKKFVKNANLEFSFKSSTFADNALFTNKHLTNTNGEIWFTANTNFDGPVHSNSSNGSMFRFAGTGTNWASATFKDEISSVSTSIKWYNTGKTTTPPVSNLNPTETKDKPVFEKGYKRGVNAIPLPTNSFNQERAALTNNSLLETAMTNAEKRSALGLPPSTSPVPTGVYLPKSGNSLNAGIYVKGDVSVRLSVNSGKQVYTLTQGSTITRIEVDYTNNKTSMCNGANCTPTPSQIYDGVPNGALYVDGSITSLGGPARTPSNSTSPTAAPPAIASRTKLTVFANNSINIDSDIKYSDNPLGPDGINNTPDDNPNVENVFGVYTSNGNITIGTAAPKNIEIHGSLMTSGSNSVVTVQNYDSRADSGVVNLLGGIISDAYGAFGTFGRYGSRTGYGRNFVYDQRLKNNPPPFFPTAGALKFDKEPVISGETLNEEK
ncbi:MAG: hypothetical protein KatS3mg068_1718 [Candidatus Sericytochromatia bacterium]|nr:MAG: hypothetical protein KatS3mg068_1718 [Candidatus Sericytochromatia bacterium]